MNLSPFSAALSILINHDPVFTGTPKITGTSEVDEMLGFTDVGTNDAEDDMNSLTLIYQWQSGWLSISGGTLATYVVTETDLDDTITCKISTQDLAGGEVSYITDGGKVGEDFPWEIFIPAIAVPR